MLRPLRYSHADLVQMARADERQGKAFPEDDELWCLGTDWEDGSMTKTTMREILEALFNFLIALAAFVAFTWLLIWLDGCITG